MKVEIIARPSALFRKNEKPWWTQVAKSSSLTCVLRVRVNDLSRLKNKLDWGRGRRWANLKKECVVLIGEQSLVKARQSGLFEVEFKGKGYWRNKKRGSFEIVPWSDNESIFISIAEDNLHSDIIVCVWRWHSVDGIQSVSRRLNNDLALVREVRKEKLI